MNILGTLLLAACALAAAPAHSQTSFLTAEYFKAQAELAKWEKTITDRKISAE